jgi:hypothetical protein
MAAARSPTTPTITFEEPSLGESSHLLPVGKETNNTDRVPTGSSELDSISEDKDHAQDWSVTTDPKDSWANRERRRSSVWSKVDDVDVTANAPKRISATGAPRRGSILSVWSTGKDKMGKDVLLHDDHEMDKEEVIEPEKEEAEQGDPDLLRMLGREKRGSNAGSDRRGSILSLWSGGKDDNGRAIVHHDDEEWKV